MHPKPRPHTRPLAWALLALAALLTGCAGPLRVDNQVRSFAQWGAQGTPCGPEASTAPRAPQRYQFDRLPSQDQGTEGHTQDRIDALAAAVLGELGWQTADSSAADAPWRVQVSANTQRLAQAPWEDPWEGYRGHFHAGIGLGGYRSSGLGGVLWIPVLPTPSSPYYLREVVVVIREASSGRVVYETRASHDGRWNSTPELWTAMLRAALQDFPSPPAGQRRVGIELTRPGR
jgi:hypothetical protein